MDKYESFAEFYRFYLNEHRQEGTRAMHFAGILGFLICLLFAFWRHDVWFFIAGVAIGYAPAISSHYIYEGNRPASFKAPFFSILSDFRMFWDLLTKKESFRGEH